MRKQLSRVGTSSVMSAALVVGFASLLSRLVGLARARVLAGLYGAGDELDAFLAAFRIPDFIFNLIVIGALSAAFIPLFTDKVVKEDKDEAFSFAASVLNIICIVVAVLSLLYAILCPYLVPLITPGFSGEKLEMTIQLSRIMALQPFLLSISFVLSGILNSFKRFVAYAFAPILYNVGIIFGAVFFTPMMGPAGLGWGVVLGAFLHVLVQLPSAIWVGFRWKPVLLSAKNDLKKMIHLTLPRMIGMAAQQVNLLIITIIGSTLVAGSITVFDFANSIQHIPIGIFGLAFAQAAFPTLSEYVSRDDKRAFRNILARTFRYILFFVIPISAFLFLLRAQMVRVVFGAGKFSWEDTILTFETLQYLIVSIFAQATIPLLTRAFYARQDTKTPVIFSIVGMAINIVLALYLAPKMGVSGLALAFSIASIIQLALLLGVLHWQLDGFNDLQVIHSVARIVIATVLASIVLQAMKYGVAAVINIDTFIGIFVQLMVAGGAGAAFYMLVCWVLRSDEIRAVYKYLPRKFKTKLLAGQETSRFNGISD